MEELVSVIVTSYNHVEYLEERMESLLKQTYSNIEIIVIDDCSKDNSLNFLSRYKKYPNTQIIGLKKNSGYVHATNLGVSLSKGQYLMFAECDDFNEPQHIETLMQVLAQNPTAGVAYSKSTIVDNHSISTGDDFQFREKAFREYCYQNTLIPQKKMQKFLLHSCVVPNMSAALIRKEYFNEIGGLSSSYKICSDWDMWNRLAQSCDFYYVTTPLNNFRFHQTTARNTFSISLQVSEIFRLLYDSFSKQDLSLVDRYKFKLNTAIIWLGFLNKGFIPWLQSFPSIWIESIKYENLSIVYLLLGSVAKIIWSIIKKLR